MLTRSTTRSASRVVSWRDIALPGFDSVTFHCHNGFVEPMLELQELCERTGVTARTVRYYIQSGLVDRPLALEVPAPALVEDAGRKCVLVRGDLADPAHCRAVIDRAAEEFGGIDVVVSNAAFQMSHDTLDEISDEEWEHTFATNVSAFFYLVKAALPHMSAGGSIIGSLSLTQG